MTVEYRQAVPSDAEQLFELGRNTLPVFYTAREFSRFILNRTDSVVVAETDKKIVGYCYSSRMSERRQHVKSFAVDSEHRRKRIGKTLMERVVESAGDDGCSFVSLYVMRSNTGAIAFYTDFGFQQVGVKKDYYGAGEDGIVLAIRPQMLQSASD